MSTQPATDLADASLRLDDRVVIVTGASSGIGVQLAKDLDRAGASLALVARRADRLEALAETFRDALPVAADLGDDTAPETIVAKTVERFGKVDGLVNNAGITNVAPALRETPEEFARVLQINLVAPFALARACAISMRESGGGSIVNVASIVGLRSMRPLPEAGYAASKSGLLGLTRELATQWARYGIRVNAIAPGAFTTEMTDDSFEETGWLGGYIKDVVPLKRPGRPGELDSIVRVLLHPSTSFVTGQVIAIDGGQSAAS